MKKAIFTFMAMLLATLAVQAATSYGINIGGVEVTSDNYNNVTGGDISGSVSYNPSTKTLTLTDAFIYRSSGSENYALHNKSCDGLTVRLIGQNYLVSNNANAIRINNKVSMYIIVEGGIYNSIQSNSTDAIFAQSDSRYSLDFKGSGYVRINAPSGYGMKSDNSIHCEFGNGSGTLEVEIIGAKGAVNWYHQMAFGTNCIVSMKATGNSSYPTITCGILGYSSASASELLYARIDKPQGAVVSSDRTTIIKNGSPVYNEDIVIVSKNLGYSVGINSTNFPDGNFRNYLISLFPKRYLTQTDINNLTSLNCPSKYINTLQGIGIFTALQELRCNNNRLSSLDLSNNTALTYLDCSHNNLTGLYLYDHNSLETLYCNDNQLTSLTLPPTSSNALQAVNCSNNMFTSLSIKGYSNLTSLDASNNSSLTSFLCYSNNLSTINVTNCPALTTLICYSISSTYTTLDLTGTTALTYLDCGPAPYLTSITNLTNCTGMKTLVCYDTQMSNLSAVSSMPALEYLSCHHTKITSLDVSNKYSLNTLYCHNNPNLTSLSCQNCTLTTLDCRNCPAMTTLKCSSNDFTTFNVTDNTALTYLNCSPNTTLTSITGLSSCTAMKNLYCAHTGLTDLSAVAGMTNLETLNCSNTKLTSLTLQNKSNLTEVYCYYIPTMTTVTITGNRALTSLYCFNNQALTTLNVSNNNLSVLDVEDDTALTTLNCSQNSNLTSITRLSSCTNLTSIYISSCNFSSFDASSFSYLQELNCHDNKLTSLNVSGKTSLKRLFCYNNQLTSLNVQGCSAMTLLSTGGNKLTSLYVQGCNSLNDVRVQANKFTEAGMNTLIGTLPTRSSSDPGMLCVLDYTDPSIEEQNVITNSQIDDAANKYWYAKIWDGSDWVDLELTQPGDVTGDGVFNITDATDLIQMLLNGDVSLSQCPAADYNGDGVVNISDVTDMISYLLSN